MLLLSKIAFHLIDFMYCDSVGLQKIKNLCQDRKSRVIFLPMFKSFSDILIMHFLNYHNDLELGFTFGNYEDSPKNAFVERLLKRIGCFTIKRKESHNMNLNYVN